MYDLHQLPKESIPQLRDFLFNALKKYQTGPKLIRTQLSICLVHLAIQMLEWKDVLETVVTTLQGEPAGLPCIFEFLKVLPEEVTEGRKIQLSVCRTAALRAQPPLAATRIHL